MKKKSMLEGILLLILSAFFINESLKLRGQEALSLSPALFPLIITSFLFVLSIILIIRSFNEADEEKKNSNIKPLFLIIAVSFLYLFLLPKVHFIVSSVLYLLSFLIILGERRWKIIVPISIITPILVYFIFGNLLNVLLP